MDATAPPRAPSSPSSWPSPVLLFPVSVKPTLNIVCFLVFACHGLLLLALRKASRLTASDFPVGRLHNVVIAPKRSGDRSSINTNKTTVRTPGHGVTAPSSGNSSATSKAALASAVKPLPVPVAVVTPANPVASAEWEEEGGVRKAGAAGGDDAAGSGSHEDLG